MIRFRQKTGRNFGPQRAFGILSSIYFGKEATLKMILHDSQKRTLKRPGDELQAFLLLISVIIIGILAMILSLSLTWHH